MARRRKHHEDHGNHEAWAIPYADLMTLLLAFFVVMYAISSLNEGKYKVMAQALTTAFGGASTAASPVQVGRTQTLGADYDRPSVIKAGAPMAASRGPTDPTLLPSMAAQMRMPVSLRNQAQLARAQRQMDAVAQQLGKTLAPLIDQKLITIRRNDLWIEVEINSDILFGTGSAALAGSARGTLSALAAVLRDAPNGVRVEGYTDNQPIATAQFPPTGSCRPRAPPAWCTCLPTTASPRSDWRWWAMENSAHVPITALRRDGMRTGVWC